MLIDARLCKSAAEGLSVGGFRQLAEEPCHRSRSVHCGLVGAVVAIVVVIDRRAALKLGISVVVAQHHAAQRLEYGSVDRAVDKSAGDFIVVSVTYH